jgi:Na+/H+ antiporter NhaD/arsenite permease-like protein
MKFDPKVLFLLLVVVGVSVGGRLAGLATDFTQTTTLAVFSGVIATTLFFWERRVAAAFLGVSVLIATHAMSLHSILKATELDIIFFLVGMMIIVGVLKDLGFLTWVIQSIINRKTMNGISFTAILCVLSAVLASVVDEVSSIVVVLALVFQVCDTLKLRPHPFVLIAVMATNIGSSATMLGNPVGIFIGNKAGLTFAQFLVGATPVAVAALVATLGLVIFWFRKDIRSMTLAMARHRRMGLGPVLKIPYKTGLFILLATVSVIAFHHQIEHALALGGAENKNAFLIMTPLIVAGLLMIWRPHRARHYVEKDVEWWTLLFFMLLFAIAGSLSEQGITKNLAESLTEHVKGGPKGMIPFVLVIASLGSAFVDNIVFVAAFTPVIQSLVERAADYSVLWWALLFGACFGGNITVVGSTANIVASGLLEKHGHHPIRFGTWIRLGAIVGLVTAVIAWVMLLVIPSPRPASVDAPKPPPAAVAPGDLPSLNNG